MKKLRIFGATWCGPCGVLKKQIEESDIPADLIEHVDVDQNQEEAQKQGIRGVPTLVFENNGVQFDKMVGIPPIADIKQRLL